MIFFRLSRTHKRSVDLGRGGLGGGNGNGKIIAPAMSNESSSSSHARKGAILTSPNLSPVASR